MSTKNHTDTTNVYNPASMSNYNMFQSQLGNQYMNMLTNPLATSFFRNQLAQQKNYSNQLAQNSVRNMTQNLRAGGGILSNSGAFGSALLSRVGIGNNLMQANAFNSSLNNALNNRNFALTGMASYNPLQTGQNSVSYQTGAGTWAGPLAAAALNIAMPGIGGMMSGAGFMGGMRGAFGGGGGGTPGPAMSAPQLPFGGPSNNGAALGNAFSQAMQTPPYQF